jgi:PAS domain S-box-containing protein
MILTTTMFPVTQAFSFTPGRLVSRVKEYCQSLFSGKSGLDSGNLYAGREGAELILEHSDTAYILIDTELQVVTFNHVAEQFTTSTFQKELKEKTHSLDYFPRERRSAIKSMLVDALMGIDSGYEILYPGNEGTQIWYEVKIRGVKKEGRPVGTMMSVRNITEKKTMEVQREKMTTDLLQHNRNLAQFSYIVSHNLRAPLANIIGLADVLTMPGVDDAQKDEFLRHIAIASRKLDEVIIDLNTILHLRNENDEKKQPVTFTSVLDEVKTALKDAVPGLHVHIQSDFSQADRIESVKSYLYNIFYNLVSNSIKFRKQETEPVIAIQSRVTNGMLELSFKDNGTGIDLSRNGDKIFGLYKRFHSNVEGKGMGLYMTRIQVEKLGGNISVESALNKGTEFKIRFL